MLCVRFCHDVRCCWQWALRGYFKRNCRWRWRHTSVSAVIHRKAHQCPGCVLTRLRGRGSGLESVTLAEAQCQPGPGHHSLPLSRVLFKGKQISGPNVTARTRSLPLISTNQCPGLKWSFPLPSPPLRIHLHPSTPLTTASQLHPLKPTHQIYCHLSLLLHNLSTLLVSSLFRKAHDGYILTVS